LRRTGEHQAPVAGQPALLRRRARRSRNWVLLAIWVVACAIPLYLSVNAILGGARIGPVADSPHVQFEASAARQETWIPGHMHTVVALRDDPHSRGSGNCHVTLLSTTAWEPEAVTFAWQDDHHLTVTYPLATPTEQDETRCSVQVRLIGNPLPAPGP
jgi:hypothetical protein